MKYDHAVKYNGVIYPTGADVPVVEEVVQEKPTEPNEEDVKEPVGEEVKEPVQGEEKEPKKEKVKTK